MATEKIKKIQKNRNLHLLGSFRRSFLNRLPDKLLLSFTEGFAAQMRARYGRRLSLASDDRVRLGALTGLKLPSNSKWSGSSDLASMTFGEYERQVIDHLHELEHFDFLIDLGASWGYYAVGLQVSGLVAQNSVIAFEMNPLIQHELQETAKSNKVRLEIRGEASSTEVSDLIQSLDVERGLLICDIEGAEYEIFSGPLLVAALDWYLVIELHDESKNTELLNTLSRSHRVSVLENSQVQISSNAVGEVTRLLPEISRDYLVAALLMDGRRIPQKWAVCKPIAK